MKNNLKTKKIMLETEQKADKLLAASRTAMKGFKGTLIIGLGCAAVAILFAYGSDHLRNKAKKEIMKGGRR